MVKKQLRERDIEAYLVRKIEAIGGKAFKFSSPSNRGVPDRVCCLPFGKVIFVECKAPGKKPTPLQQRVITQMKKQFQQAVFIIDSKASVDAFCDAIKMAIKKHKEKLKNDGK